MPEPILAIDFGTSTSAAMLVTDAGEQVITERSGTGLTWPSAVCFDGTELHVGTRAENLKRVHADHGRYRAEFKLELGRDAPVALGGESFPVLALVTAMLAEIRAAAERATRAPVTRAVITIPASYDEGDTRRGLMTEAAEQAGFDVVELVPEPVAAALAPVSGPPFPEGSLILVYDLGGGTFDTALVRIGQQANKVLGHAAIDPSRGGHGSGGRDIDAALYDDLLKSAGKPLADLVTTSRTRLQLLAETEKLKRRLTEGESAEDYFGDSDVLLAATRDRLEELAAPVIERTVDCVRTMLAGTGTAVDEVDEVLLVGGASQMPVVEQAVAAALGRPIRTARAPQLAVVQGAARFAAAAPTRFTVPLLRGLTERPLRWPFPGEPGQPAAAIVMRWRVPVGGTFGSGDVLADVRLGDGAIWELRADRPGRLQARHALEGDRVFSGDWLVTAAELSPESVVKVTTLLEVTRSGGYHIHSVAFSPNGLTFATGHYVGHVLIWNAGTGGQIRQLAVSGNEVPALAYSPDSARLAAAASGSVVLWDVNSGGQLSTLNYGGATGLCFHPDGKRLATSGADVRIWDFADGSHVSRSPVPANDVCFSPDGSKLVSAHEDGNARVWSEPVGDLTVELEHPDPVFCLAYTADGAWIATGSRHGLVTIWDARSGQPVRTLSGPDVDILDLAFNPDDTLLAVAAGNICRLWDAVTGDALTSVQHTGVHRLGFDPVGRRLVTAGADDYARTWLIG
jgi:hypothetical protein